MQEQTIGNYLLHHREEHHLELEDIVRATKINPRILKALEEDRLNDLPSKTYVKGFVKNYVKLLKLDEDEALSHLEYTYNLLVPNAPEPLSIKKTVLTEDPIEKNHLTQSITNFLESLFSKKAILPLVIILAVILLIYLGQSLWLQLSSETKKVQEIQKKMPMTPPPSPQEKDKKVIVKEEKKATPKVQPKKEIETKPQAKQEAPLSESDKQITKDELYPLIDFRPIPSVTFALVEDAPEINDSTIFPQKFKERFNPELQNVLIYANEGNTWLTYQEDDKEIRRFTLSQGHHLFLQGSTILLFMGNVHAAHIFYNNQLIKAHSRTGVKSILFPPEKYQEYKLPFFPAVNGIPQKQSEYIKHMSENIRQ